MASAAVTKPQGRGSTAIPSERLACHPQRWEAVQTSGGDDAVAVGNSIVPLDWVSAGEMPGMAARLRIETQDAWLRALYSRQVLARNALVSPLRPSLSAVAMLCQRLPLWPCLSSLVGAVHLCGSQPAFKRKLHLLHILPCASAVTPRSRTLQLRLLNLASHGHDPRAGLASAAAPEAPWCPQVAPTGPDAALVLERQVAERARRLTKVDLGGSRLTDSEASALALLLPRFTNGLDELCVAGTAHCICVTTEWIVHAHLRKLVTIKLQLLLFQQWSNRMHCSRSLHHFAVLVLPACGNVCMLMACSSSKQQCSLS